MIDIEVVVVPVMETAAARKERIMLAILEGRKQQGRLNLDRAALDLMMVNRLLEYWPYSEEALVRYILH